MQYQKILKRTGYVYQTLISESEKKQLEENPHTKGTFEFRAVKVSTVTVTNEGQSTEAKEVKKLPKQVAQTEQ